MNIDEEQNNNSSLLNTYQELKLRYQQIYASNKLHFLQNPMDYESKPLWFHKKYTKYIGSNRLLDMDEYQKLTNINKYNLSEQENKQHKPQQQEDSSISATDSLSFVEDEKYSIKFTDSMLWHELLKQQQGIFQPLDFEDFLITSLTNSSERLENFDILIDQGYYSQLYQGFCLKNKESIAIKIQFFKILQLVENQYSYSLQAEIYNFYPKQFLKIDLPVYVQQYVPDQLEIISKYELGQINLYKYSLQKKIDENEINLIYQQVLKQILLLHKHKIAHRDIKPQNIVFVENKGWLLCDFEFSMKYQNLITICQIKGTKCFLPPYLYQISNIQGVEAKQDLFFNDQYALGITLIVIKHQIQNSNNLQDFLLNETDPNILFLLKESQKDKLYQQFIDYENSFIKPYLMPIIKEFSNKLETYQLIQIIKTLQLFANNNLPLRNQLIQIIDDNLENGRDDYLYLNFQIYENLTIYLTQFKNLINLQTLKSSKFWILAFQQENKQIELYVLKFMQNLGLQELLLKLGKLYLNSKYSIAVHVLMIKMLFFLKEDNQVYEEYKQMLKIKEFQYMTSVEQSEFIQFTIQSFHWNLIDEKDILYIEQFYQNKNFKIDEQVLDLYKNEKDAEESFLNFVCEKQNHQDKPQAIFNHFQEFIMKFGQNQLNLCSNHCLKLYHLGFQTLDLKQMVTLDKLLLNQVKFFSSIIQYQQLLKQSMYLQFLYTQNLLILSDRQKVMKCINSMFMFQQESQQQQNILNIIKQSSTLIYRIKNPRKIFQIIKRVSDMCNKFDDLTFNFYKIVFLDQVNQILYDSRINHDHSRFWYRIGQWQTKKIKLVNKQIEYAEIVRHYDNMINYWISTRNQKRHDELVFQLRNPTERKMLKQRYEYKFAQIHDDIPILIKLKQTERLMNLFLQVQNLYR